MEEDIIMSYWYPWIQLEEYYLDKDVFRFSAAFGLAIFSNPSNKQP